MRCIHIRNWDKFQHRDVTRNKKHAAPWIIDYTGQLREPEWLDLTFADRGLLQSLRLEYAANRGRGLPDSTATLGRLLGWRVYRSQLERLEQAGFIEFLPASRAQVASLQDKRREEINQGRTASSCEGNGQGNEIEERRLIRESAVRSLKEATL